MARARNIKPSFFTNEIIGTIDPIIGMTFVGLWCLADKDGRLEDRPLRIKAELFPYRDSLDVNGYLTVLERSGFIDRYKVDGTGYIQITNFEKHQSPHHTERAKGYPPKPLCHKKLEDLTVNEPLQDGKRKVSTRSDSLIPDSLIPDSKTNVELADAKSDDSLEVFNFWKLTMGHGRAKFDAKRKKLIGTALRIGYTVDDLKSAITGCASSPWHMGKNDSGQRYDGIELILRSAEKIDQFIAMYIAPPRPAVAAQAMTQHQLNQQAIARSIGLLPPERTEKVIGGELV